MTGQYGLHDVWIGSPCVIDENGVESVIELRFDPAEQKALEASGAVL
jgi:L-lactate dehydrogenase